MLLKTSGITAHTVPSAKVWNNSCGFSPQLRLYFTEKILSLYQFISMSFVWAALSKALRGRMRRIQPDITTISHPPNWRERKMNMQNSNTWNSLHRWFEKHKHSYYWWKRQQRTIICHLWNGKVLKGGSCGKTSITYVILSQVLSSCLPAFTWAREYACQASPHKAKSCPRQRAHKYSLICCSFGFPSGGLYLIMTVPEGRQEYRRSVSLLRSATQKAINMLAVWLVLLLHFLAA